jgi:glyoxylase-like metal-dependent hydrolase (beta-lactamase superfamily II)
MEAGYPTVYRFYDYFQACMFYIQGPERAIVFDGGQAYPNASGDYADLLKLVLSLPEVSPLIKREYKERLSLVIGHGHPDHYAAAYAFYREGVRVFAHELSCDGTAGAIVSGAQGDASFTETRAQVNARIIRLIEGDEPPELDLGGGIRLAVTQLPGHQDGLVMLQDKKNELIFSTDMYGCVRYHTADMFDISGVATGALLSLEQQAIDLFERGGAAIKEVYTGHNRVAISKANLVNNERCVQDIVDWGAAALDVNHRGGGYTYSTVGDMYTNPNWMAIVPYRGDLDAYDPAACAWLSNLTVREGEGTLAGHEFNFKSGYRSGNTYPQGPGEVLPAFADKKYVIYNKFVPWDLEYDVWVPAGRGSVTLTPTAMSTLYARMEVDGAPQASRCPFTVALDASAGAWADGANERPAAVARIKVTAKDGATERTYTLTFKYGAFAYDYRRASLAAQPEPEARARQIEQVELQQLADEREGVIGR